MRMLALFLLVLLVACAPAAEESPPTPPPTTAARPTTNSPTPAPAASPTATGEPLPTMALSTGAPTVAPAVEPTATEPPAATPSGPVAGRNDDGTFFFGAADAPLALTDYSDFLWSTCRAHVLGAEREIIANEVAAGQVRLVFWPILDLGPNSLNAATTATCAGEQDPAAFWAAHDTLFENQGDLYGADRQYFVDLAATLGLDGAAFATCYDGEAVREQLSALDAARREAGIFNRPTFDLNGQRLIGAQPYDTFAAAFAALLP